MDRDALPNAASEAPLADKPAATPKSPSKRVRWIAISAIVVGTIVVVFATGLPVKMLLHHYAKQATDDDPEKAYRALDELQKLTGGTLDTDGHHFTTYSRPSKHAKLGPWAVPFLATAIDKHGERVCFHVVMRLGAIREPEAYETLVRISKDQRLLETTRYYALFSLGTTGDPRAFDYLMQWFPEALAIEQVNQMETSREEDNAYTAIPLHGVLSGISDTEDPRAIQVLAPFLSSRKKPLQLTALLGLTALAARYPKEAIPYLIRATEDSDEKLRTSVSRHLSVLTDFPKDFDTLNDPPLSHEAWEAWWKENHETVRIDKKAFDQRSLNAHFRVLEKLGAQREHWFMAWLRRRQEERSEEKPRIIWSDNPDE